MIGSEANQNHPYTGPDITVSDSNVVTIITSGRANDLLKAKDIFSERYIDADDQSAKEYISRAVNANMSTNIDPIKAENDEGKIMMKMLRECEDLISCLNGTGLHYSIDGAIGLSLRQLSQSGSFLRKHRDVDLIVPKDELCVINQILHRQPKGKKWGIFIWNTDELSESKRFCFKPIDDDWNGRGMLQVIPIDEGYEIDTARYDGFTMIDMHYLEKSDDGFEYGNRKVPAKDLFAEEVMLPGGSKCHVVSHEQIAINKAGSERSQDIFDFNHIVRTIDADRMRYVIDELTALRDFTYDEKMKKIINKRLESIRTI